MCARGPRRVLCTPSGLELEGLDCFLSRQRTGDVLSNDVSSAQEEEGRFGMTMRVEEEEGEGRKEEGLCG